MVKRLLFAYLFGVCGFVNAQKVDLDELPIMASWVQLPMNPLPAELTTYSCEFSAVGFNPSQLGYSIENLRTTYYAISGFRRVEKAGHFTIKTQIDLPAVDEIKEVTQTVTEKDKDGKEIKRTTYGYSFRYLVPMRYAITDYQLNNLEEGAIADGSHARTGFTTYFDTQAKSQENWKNNRNTILTENTRSFMSQFLSSFQARLNNNFGYVSRSRQKNILWILNGSKHPEYDVYQRNYQLIKATFDRMTPETGLDRAALQPAIDYLEAIPARFPADEKADRKMRYSAYYNLSEIYYWLDDMDKSLANADLLIKNNYDKRDGEAFKTSVSTSLTRMTANRLKTRHLVRDLTNVTVPAEPAALVAQKEAEEADRKEQAQAASQSKVNGLITQLNGIYADMEKRVELNRQAIKKYDSLLVKEPKNDKYFYERGWHKQNISDGAGAVADLEQAVALKPNTLTYLDRFGRIALWAGEYDKAIGAFDKALTMTPKNEELVYQKGVAVSRTRRYPDAILLFDKAIAMNPKRVETLTERGFAYDYLRRYDMALADFTKAARLNPKSGEARFGIAYVNMNAGRFAESIPDYVAAEKMENMPRDFANRAFALANTGQMDEAKKVAEIALTRDKRYGNGYYIRGWLRAQEKNYQGALEDARQALAFGHTKPYKVHALMGDALLGLGIAGEAVKQYDMALQLWPDYPEAKVGKQKAAATN